MVIGPNKKLAWDYPFPLLIDGFRIYINGEQAWQNTDRNVLQANVSDLGLQNGGDYEARVTAYMGARESDQSEPLNFTFVEFVPVPANLRVAD